jgi:predicted ester cyclase
MTTTHTALVRRAVEAIWNRGELDVADVLFAADYVNHDGLITDLVRGPEAIKVSVALYRTAFPDLQLTVDDLTAEGDTVLLHWTARGTPAVDRSGGARTSTAGTLSGTLTSRLAGGQIVESWVQWDRDGALTQVGLLPPVGFA